MVFWDVFGEQGHPVRTTITDMGPLLLARLLNLNDTQDGVLSLVFKVADDQGLLLLDLKDLRAMLAFVGEHAAELKTTVRQRQRRQRGRHPAQPARPSRSRAATASSANRPWTWTTSSRPTPRAGAS